MSLRGPVLAVAQSASTRGDIVSKVETYVRFIEIVARATHPRHAEAAARAGATVYAAGVFITPTGIEADSVQLRSYARSHKMIVLMATTPLRWGASPRRAGAPYGTAKE